MAHELDFTAAGTAAMFSVRKTPWHKEGKVLREAPSFDEALVLGAMNYEVGLKRLYARTDDTFIEAPGARAVVRLDRWPSPSSILATVSDKYVPLQNRDAFATLIPLLDSGVCMLETGGVLRGGRDAWLMARFQVDDPVVREVFAAEVVPFAMIHANHSGLRQTTLVETPVRVVCANTLAAAYGSVRSARGRAIGVSHVGDARVKLVEAAEKMFGGLVERYRGIAQQFKEMKETILTVEQFASSVQDIIAPLPERPGSFPDRAARMRFDRAHHKAEVQRTALHIHWERGAGHTGNHSAWEAYNGAVEALDHDDATFPARGSRLQSLVDGRLLDEKAKVAQAVHALCTVSR